MLVIAWTRSLKLTLSAQAMSQPFDFQSPMRCHACQCWLMMIAMPEPLALEKAWELYTGLGPGMGMVGRETVERVDAHHFKSLGVSWGGVLGLKGLSPNMDSMDLMLMR